MLEKRSSIDRSKEEEEEGGISQRENITEFEEVKWGDGRRKKSRIRGEIGFPSVTVSPPPDLTNIP